MAKMVSMTVGCQFEESSFADRCFVCYFVEGCCGCYFVYVCFVFYYANMCSRQQALFHVLAAYSMYNVVCNILI